MFRVERLTKRFANGAGAGPLTLQLPRGSTYALIGPSGCGKSTFLRLLNGLLTPDEGTVEFDGQRLTPANLAAIRQRIGYVIQDGGLFPHLSARGNVSLQAEFLGWSAQRIAARMAELRELVKLPDDLLDREPARLSGGQRQRVSLMRALMLDPAALLLDEPLGALDPMIRAELQDDLQRIFAELEKTVVLVTHDLAEASHFSRDILLMDDGRVVQRGSLRDLTRQPANEFVERFVTAQRTLHAEAPA
ncbi:MAG: ABC transporter ATP-binding protein [Planctomycetaceae bacterium]|nr:ABC transporter ATP-binding protein [Planctomycetaceae bacterium]